MFIINLIKNNKMKNYLIVRILFLSVSTYLQKSKLKKRLKPCLAMKFNYFFFNCFLIFNSTIMTDSIKIVQLQDVIITRYKNRKNYCNLVGAKKITMGESIQKSVLSLLNEIIQEQSGLIMS